MHDTAVLKGLKAAIHKTGSVKMPAWLSISGGNLDERCEYVMHALAKTGIGGDVTPNRSITKSGVEENGCRVFVLGSDADVKRLWTTLKEKQDLQCAHISIANYQNGCIYDVYGTSRCPDCYVTTAMENTTS